MVMEPPIVRTLPALLLPARAFDYLASKVFNILRLDERILRAYEDVGVPIKKKPVS